MSFVGEMAKVFDKLGPYPDLSAWLARDGPGRRSSARSRRAGRIVLQNRLQVLATLRRIRSRGMELASHHICINMELVPQMLGPAARYGIRHSPLRSPHITARIWPN